MASVRFSYRVLKVGQFLKVPADMGVGVFLFLFFQNQHSLFVVYVCIVLFRESKYVEK